MSGLYSLLDISRRSLLNQSRALQVVGNNVANIGTEGYSKREIIFGDRTSPNPGTEALGLGADIKEVVRRTDEFINKSFRRDTSELEAAKARDSVLLKAQVPFSVDKTLRHIGFELSNFSNALNDLQTDPSNIPLRANFIDAGKSLTQSIRLTYNTLGELQREADKRIISAVQDVNLITEQIATLNLSISTGETKEQKNLGLRDQRDQLLVELSKKLSFDSVEDSSGQVSVTLNRGFSLVNAGNYSLLKATSIPSFGGNRRAIDNGVLTAIVTDSDSSATVNDIDFTNIISQGGGELAGLLKSRGVFAPTAPDVFYLAQGDLPDVASRIEAISQILLRDLNNVYRPKENLATVASEDLYPSNAATPIYGLFNVASNPAITPIGDSNGDNTENYADMIASGYRNFSSIINFVPTDPVALALSKDEDATPANGVVAFSKGNGQIATDLLNALRVPRPNLTVGTFSSTNLTLEDIYTQTVSFVGGLKSASSSDLEFATDKRTQTAELKNSESGISMDEELSKLIGYQKTFQASSKLIKTASDLLLELLNTVAG